MCKLRMKDVRVKKRNWNANDEQNARLGKDRILLRWVVKNCEGGKEHAKSFFKEVFLQTSREIVQMHVNL